MLTKTGSGVDLSDEFFDLLPYLTKELVGKMSVLLYGLRKILDRADEKTEFLRGPRFARFLLDLNAAGDLEESSGSEIVCASAEGNACLKTVVGLEIGGE